MSEKTQSPSRQRRHAANQAKVWRSTHPDTMPAQLPDRGYEKGKEAFRGSVWFAVKRLGPYGASQRPMFRHSTFETADREARFLAMNVPGSVFVVLGVQSGYCRGKPEVSIGENQIILDPETAPVI